MIQIKPHSIVDIELRYKWINTPDVARFVRDEPSKRVSRNEIKEWFENYRKARGTKKFFTIFVEEKAIGWMGLSNISKENENAELFIAIGEDEYRGKGYGYEALSWLLDYGFRKIGLNKITLGVVDANLPAINLYKKAGFVVEGHMKEDVKIEGKWYGMLAMAIFWKDYRKKSL